MKRRPDSVRFDPYYKVQAWDDRLLAWIDVQMAFPTADDAMASVTASGRFRLMVVFPGGRRPDREWVRG